MGTRTRSRERLHPAAFGTVLLILVGVGRLPELVPSLGALALGDVAAVMGVIGLLLGRWREDVPVFQTSTGRLMALFTAVAAFSVVISIWHGKSIEVFLGNLLTNLVLFFLIARSATSPRMLRVYTGAIAASAAMLATEAVIGYTQGRVEVGQAYDANDLAMVLVTILPLVAGGVLARRGMRRWALVTVAVVMLLTVLLTGSRGGILGLIAVVGYLLFARFPRPTARRRARRLTFGKVAVIGAGGLLVVAAMPQMTIERMASLADYQSDYNVTAEDGRLAIWGRGIDAMIERPWGHGIGTFEEVEMREGGRYKAAHNIWIEVGVELGIPGLLVLFGLFWTAARTASRLALRAFAEIDRGSSAATPGVVQLATLGVAVRGSLIGFFVTSLFLSVAFTGVFYALLGLIAGMEHQERALAEGGAWQGPQRRARGRRRRGPVYGGAATTFAGARGPKARSGNR